MKVFIDIGNSQLKWLLQKGNKKHYGRFDYHEAPIQELLSGISKERPEAVYVSSVAGEVNKRLDDCVGEQWQLQASYAAVSTEALGLSNGYHDITQLGVDRWLALIAAWHHYHGNVLVVDCGTAVTIDAIKLNENEPSSAEYSGGLILPGVQTMKELLVNRTHRIETVKNDTNKVPFFGRTTEQGLNSGGIQAIVALIDRSHVQLQSECQDEIHCVLTGGAAHLIQSQLNNHFEHEPHLVLSGLELWSTFK